MRARNALDETGRPRGYCSIIPATFSLNAPVNQPKPRYLPISGPDSTPRLRTVFTMENPIIP